MAATASVGLMTAPRAIAAAGPTEGSRRYSARPTTSEVTITSSTDSPVIALRLRRRSITGTDTAAEYSSGGSTPARIHSGSISNAGTSGV